MRAIYYNWCNLGLVPKQGCNEGLLQLKADMQYLYSVHVCVCAYMHSLVLVLFRMNVNLPEYTLVIKK